MGNKNSTADAVSKIVAVMVESGTSRFTARRLESYMLIFRPIAAIYTVVLIAEIVSIVTGSPLNFFFINLVSCPCARRHDHAAAIYSGHELMVFISSSREDGPTHWYGGELRFLPTKFHPAFHHLMLVTVRLHHYPGGQEQSLLGELGHVHLKWSRHLSSRLCWRPPNVAVNEPPRYLAVTRSFEAGHDDNATRADTTRDVQRGISRPRRRFGDGERKVRWT